MNKKLLLLLLSYSAMFLNGCMGVDTVNPCDVVISAHSAVTPVPRPEKEGWMARHQAMVERIAKGNVELLMVGDSITHGWAYRGKEVWAKYYGSRNAVNLGISGDRTENVLWRLENGEIENIHPKLAVVMIGTNNSNEQYTEEQIADGIKAIVCKLRTKMPETKVLILAIFPRGNAEQRKNKEQGATPNSQWAKNDKASQLASQVADNKMVFFLDINKVFLNDQGVLTRDVMPDLLHPTEKGYQLWAEAMEPTIAKLMGETK
jgi:beta-glucosidase